MISGDGLIGQVGGALADTGATMGLICGGRGNDLARVLGIPDEVEAAVGLLAAGETREIDVGEVNGRASSGSPAAASTRTPTGSPTRPSSSRARLVYAYAALRALVGWKDGTSRSTLDGERSELRGYGVAAANSRAYGGGMYAAPDAELDDGLIDVVTLSETASCGFSPASCPRSSTAARRAARDRRAARGRGPDRGRPALRRLRGRRPHRRPPGDGERCCPAPCG